jgi:hypothetical protein
MDCVRPKGAEGGGMVVLSSLVLVGRPILGLGRSAIGKLEVGTSFVLVERGVSCGS